MDIERVDITLSGEAELVDLNIVLSRNGNERSINMRSTDGGVTWVRRNVKVPNGTSSTVDVLFSFKGILTNSDWTFTVNEARQENELTKKTGKVGEIVPPFFSEGNTSFSLIKLDE